MKQKAETAACPKEKWLFLLTFFLCTNGFFQPHPSRDNLQGSPHPIANVVLLFAAGHHSGTAKLNAVRFFLCVTANPDLAFGILCAFCVARTVLQAATMMPTAFFSRCKYNNGINTLIITTNRFL